MFKYPIFQTVLRSSFSYSYLMWGFIRWKVWIPDLHEAQESTVIAPNYLSPCLMGDYHSPASECRDERIIFMTPESSAHVASQEVWGLMIFVPPAPGLFLLLLMFRNCEQPGAPRLLPPRSPGTEEEQPPSREILDQQRDQAAWDWDDWNAILSYLTQHWLHFFLSWVLAEQRGKFAIFYPSQHSTDK